MEPPQTIAPRLWSVGAPRRTLVPRKVAFPDDDSTVTDVDPDNSADPAVAFMVSEPDVTLPSIPSVDMTSEFSPAFAYFAADLFKADNMEQMRKSRESVAAYLTNLGETEEEAAAVADRIQLRYEATQHSMRGDVLLTLGRDDDAQIEYNLALLIDPDDKNWMHAVWRESRGQR